MFIERHQSRDSPEDPVVKTPSFEGKGEGLIPGCGTKIPHALWGGQKKKKNTSVLSRHPGNTVLS